MRVNALSARYSLTYRETVIERALEAKQFLVGEGLDADQMPMVHEMVISRIDWHVNIGSSRY